MMNCLLDVTMETEGVIFADLGIQHYFHIDHIKKCGTFFVSTRCTWVLNANTDDKQDSCFEWLYFVKKEPLLKSPIPQSKLDITGDIVDTIPDGVK